MTSEHTAEVIVIGLGPGGEDVAGRLALAGLDVVGVDERLVGGECPYWGCIPSKMMIRAAQVLAEAGRVPELAGEAHRVEPRWEKVADRIREQATDDWDDQVAVDRLQGKGARFVRGHGAIESRSDEGVTVTIDGTQWLATRGVVVNSGTAPAVPPVDGIGDVDYWTNHGFIEARELPDSLIVLGGGAIGCELSQVAARFGCTVTVVERAPRLLALEEPAAGDLLAKIFAAEGIDVRLGVGATHVEPNGTGGAVRVRLEDGGELTADRLLVASGRSVNVHAVGLDAVGVDPGARSVPVDEWCRVGDRVWALGDIVGHGAFTHMSMYEADVVVRDVLGQGGAPARYDAIPRVTFTEPEVGAVGLTADAARKQLSNVRVATVDLADTTRGWIHGPGGQGFITVVEDADRGVLVGATSAGPTGGEVLGFLALAVSVGVPVQSMIDMPYAYPTIHRGIQQALQKLRTPA
ncbi:dihydrolipoyl dehydrogenase family protein [Angustibacter sp. McL0619]|uniref:dihydrolipoyl dehydrogenase family protein n=1 Tax=Angustibacter sp. McL0619 TaxID=3415676 RepID=UPI003CEBB096